MWTNGQNVIFTRGIPSVVALSTDIKQTHAHTQWIALHTHTANSEQDVRKMFQLKGEKRPWPLD